MQSRSENLCRLKPGHSAVIFLPGVFKNGSKGPALNNNPVQLPVAVRLLHRTISRLRDEKHACKKTCGRCCATQVLCSCGQWKRDHKDRTNPFDAIGKYCSPMIFYNSIADR